jgi:hypothetical protein
MVRPMQTLWTLLPHWPLWAWIAIGCGVLAPLSFIVRAHIEAREERQYLGIRNTIGVWAGFSIVTVPAMLLVFWIARRLFG